MAWIESHQEIGRHPKTLKLASEMNWSVREAVGALHLFWHWCVDYAEDGDLSNFDDSVLAIAVGLEPSEAKRFIDSMVSSGYIERNPTLQVHDWWDYIGRFLQVKYKHKPKEWKRIRGRYKNRSKNRKKNPKPNLTKPLTKPEENTPLPPLVNQLFEFWISTKNLTRHRELTPDMRIAINRRKGKGYSLAQIESAITKYDDLSVNGHAPGYGKWGISELMRSKYFDNLLDPNWEGFTGKPKAVEERSKTIDELEAEIIANREMEENHDS